VRNLRLYTTVHPHDVGTGDVATTAPAEHRMRHWECAELHYTHGTPIPGCPGLAKPRLPSAHHLRQAGGGCIRSPPSTIVLPTVLDPLDVGRALPWDAAMLPSLRDSRGRGPPGREGSGLPCNDSGRVPFTFALPTDPPVAGSDRPCTGSARCPSPSPFRRLLRRVAAFRATVPDDALRLCPSDRLPRGSRPSVRQLQAGAFRFRSSDRFPP
jgi:hypothetical protein